MALDTIQQPELAQIERIGEADLVVGILDPNHKGEAGAAVGMVREAGVEPAFNVSQSLVKTTP